MIKPLAIVLQGEIVYELVGLYPSENFFLINGSTGEVSLKTSLRADSLKSTSYLVRSPYFIHNRISDSALAAPFR